MGSLIGAQTWEASDVYAQRYAHALPMLFCPVGSCWICLDSCAPKPKCNGSYLSRIPKDLHTYLLRMYLDPPGAYIKVPPITLSVGMWIHRVCSFMLSCEQLAIRSKTSSRYPISAWLMLANILFTCLIKPLSGKTMISSNDFGVGKPPR